MSSTILSFLVLTSPFWVSSSALYSYEEPNFLFTEARIWRNNASLTDTISYEDGSFARLILMAEGNDSVPLPSFGCGFICTGGDANCSFAVLILGGVNASVVNKQVWMANRDRPIGEDGALEFTSDGGLVLQDSAGIVVWSSRTTGKSLVGIQLGGDGNLQIYNNFFTIWQSFDEPSDTLLPGQKLYIHCELVASASANNWSSGRYSIRMAPDGLTAFVQANGQFKYLQLVPWKKRRQLLQRSNTITYRALRCPGYHRCQDKAETPPHTCAVHDGENLTVDIDKSKDDYRISFESTAGFYRYLRLGFDGHLRTYQWENNANEIPEDVYDFVTRHVDYCQHPNVCGNYSICNIEGKCSCPKSLKNGTDYFKQIEGGLGCSENVAFSCQSPLDQYHQLVNFGKLSYFLFMDDQAPVPKLRNLDACKKACLDECECRAAFFKYNSNISDGECYLPSMIMSIRANPIPGNEPYNSSAFIKVQIPYMPPSPAPVNGIVSPSSPRPAPVNGIVPPSSPRPAPVNGNVSLSSPLHKPRKKKRLAPFISSSAAIGIVLFLAALWIVILKKNKKKQDRDEGEEYFHVVLKMPKRFSYEELSAATGDFKDQLGGGGFGTVFKGELKDGTTIAVKRLDNRGQGMKEFLAEVETIGHVNHFNLVRLIGFCADKSCQLLVYEYMSNGSLDKWIFNSQKNMDINWQTRKKIILDIARGLAYLHEECRQRIVHLDIKPQNILLDGDFNAKVSDFGLSKLMTRDQSQVQTTMRGTPGYLAPEWQQLRITLKVDVYSFGIVVLEIISGRRNLDRSQSETGRHLLRLLQEKAEANRLIDIIQNSSTDIQLHEDEVLKVIKLSVWCLQDDHTRRPQMSTVVKVLEGVMQVEPNISYRFCHAMVRSPTVAVDSEPPQPSLLSVPR